MRIEPATKVTVTDLDIKFFTLVWLMTKIMFATLPAIFLGMMLLGIGATSFTGFAAAIAKLTGAGGGGAMVAICPEGAEKVAFAMRAAGYKALVTKIEKTDTP